MPALKSGVALETDTTIYLTFEGHYTFRNPLDVEVPGRFVFPLPEPPGTIEGFQLTVGHNVITQPDRRGYYSWEGSLPPQATLTAVVKFRATADRLVLRHWIG